MNTDKTCDMHQPLEFTPAELQRMDDDRGEREVYRMEEDKERTFDAEDDEEWQRRSEEQGAE